MDEKSRLLEQAEDCRRIAERINEPVAAGAVLRLAEEYEQKAGAVKEIPDIEASNTTTGDENAITILREFEQARINLAGKAVVLSDGKAGAIDRVYLDELHGLRISIEGHDGQWPISTVKFAGNP
jgi:hypothetical protein